MSMLQCRCSCLALLLGSREEIADKSALKIKSLFEVRPHIQLVGRLVRTSLNPMLITSFDGAFKSRLSFAELPMRVRMAKLNYGSD